jgi:hypothetical protein
VRAIELLREEELIAELAEGVKLFEMALSERVWERVVRVNRRRRSY